MSDGKLPSRVRGRHDPHRHYRNDEDSKVDCLFDISSLFSHSPVRQYTNLAPTHLYRKLSQEPIDRATGARMQLLVLDDHPQARSTIIRRIDEICIPLAASLSRSFVDAVERKKGETHPQSSG